MSAHVSVFDLKRFAEASCGSPVTSAHVTALRALVEHWAGQGPVALPGGVRVERAGPRLACVHDGRAHHGPVPD